MERRQFLPVSFTSKAVDDGARRITGNLSTSHLDSGDGWRRDIVWPGAFKRTLDAFRASDRSYVPLIDSHDYYSVLNVFGHLVAAEEQLTGQTLRYPLEDGGELEVPEMALHTEWQIIDGDDGKRLMDRLRPGSVRKMSMGYEPVKWDIDRLASGDNVRNLREVNLREGSLVVWGMNDNAEITAVKAMARLEALGPEDAETLDRTQLEALHLRLGALLDGPGLAPNDPKRAALARRLRYLGARNPGRLTTPATLQADDHT